MVNYDYLYDKSYFKKYTEVDHRVECQLSWQEYDNAVILPYRKIKGVRMPGGLCDKNGNYIDGSGLHRGLGSRYAYEAHEVRESDETIIFLGLWPNIWGHVLTDNIRRLWVLFDKEFMKRYGHLRFLYIPHENKLPGENALRFLEILGIGDIRLEPVFDILKFKKIIIPDECFFRESDGNRFFTKEYEEMIGRVRSYGIRNLKKTKSDRVYFTHSNFSGLRSVGEDRLERFFKELGYKIISPEKYSFEEQLNIFLNCKEFVSTIGSLSHNTVFLREHTKVFLIPRACYITEYQWALDQIVDTDTVYVDSALTMYLQPEHPWGGPFYYIVSDNLKKCFNVETYEVDNEKGFLQFKKVFFILNGSQKIQSYYREIYPKYLKLSAEKVEQFPVLARVLEKLRFRAIEVRIFRIVEKIYAAKNGSKRIGK